MMQKDHHACPVQIPGGNLPLEVNAKPPGRVYDIRWTLVDNSEDFLTKPLIRTRETKDFSVAEDDCPLVKQGRDPKSRQPLSTILTFRKNRFDSTFERYQTLMQHVSSICQKA